MKKNLTNLMHSSINQLILGDNLEILRKIDSETVDLMYIDPPFFSNRNYEVIWGDKGEVRSFEDRFSGGIDHYIAWLKERIAEMHRILKPTGSIFVHCDWHADAYIRVEILDKIFGEKNFRGHIIWQRHNSHNDAKKKLAVLTDTIWYYSKSNVATYNPIYVELNKSYVSEMYRYEDEKGTYRLDNLTGPNINLKDERWKNYHPSDVGRSWSVAREAVFEIVGKESAKSMTTNQKLDLLFENNLIEISKNGVPNFKRYLENSKGQLVGNIWTDINNVGSKTKERIGYPTQKPTKLLERIILMASNEGDLILDCFVGGGTTVAVADQLNRRWIGIDQSVQAIKVTEFRLNKQQDLFSQPFSVILHKYDYDTLRYKDAFEFETFIVQQFGGISHSKQRGDFGIDGKTRDNVPIQVKRSDTIGRNVIDNFLSAAQRFDSQLFDQNIADQKPVGHIIAFSFGRGAIEEVARLKNQKGIIIKLEKVEEIVPIAKKPIVSTAIVDKGTDSKGLRCIELIAKAESIAGIEFFSWDFDFQADKGFKPTVIMDKTGEQAHKFEAGIHHIAVKVVDNDGLDTIEIIKLKINGDIQRETS